jgi:hypothetical protein
MNPDPLSEDRSWQASGECEQRRVPPLAGAVNPVALEPSRETLGGDVLAGIPTRISA